MSENYESNVEAAVAAGRQAVGIGDRVGYHGEIPIAIDEKGGEARIVVFDELLQASEERAAAPRRRTGTSRHQELASFVEHVKRHAGPDSTIWADVERVRFVAIYDYNPAGSDPAAAAWAKHRAEYGCPLSPDWKLWTEHAGKWMRQEEFADFLEENFEQITSGEGNPAPLDLLEMAKNIRIETQGRYERVFNPTTGEYNLVAKEEHSKERSTKIHGQMMLALAVFRGGDIWAVPARIRFRLRDGAPVFSYSIRNPDAFVEKAFGEYRERVGLETGVPVFTGTPEG